MDNLPTEIIQLVASYLKNDDITRLSLVSKRLFDILSTKDSPYFAIKYGYLEIVKCISGITTVGMDVCFISARFGNLECLKYFHKKGCTWDSRTCAAAANGGHLDCLRYARENGCQWHIYTTTYAAKGGHLDCLRYAYENGCQRGIQTTTYAAKGGHLDCLRYAYENGFKWFGNECYEAAEKGHLDCLRYAHENGTNGRVDLQLKRGIWIVSDTLMRMVANGTDGRLASQKAYTRNVFDTLLITVANGTDQRMIHMINYLLGKYTLYQSLSSEITGSL
jgi:hypothetical protein